MPIANTQPTSTNYLAPNFFSFRMMRLPTTNFTLQSANLPGVSLGRLDHPNPAMASPLQGDRLFFADLTVTFIVTEDMQNYKDIWEWMAGIANHNTSYTYGALKNNDQTTGESLKSDATLTILNSAKVPQHRIQFSDMFPIQLSDLMFDTQADGSQYIKAQCTMTYRDYSFDVVSG